jgi:hypothetical protein
LTIHQGCIDKNVYSKCMVHCFKSSFANTIQIKYQKHTSHIRSSKGKIFKSSKQSSIKHKKTTKRTKSIYNYRRYKHFASICLITTFSSPQNLFNGIISQQIMHLTNFYFFNVISIYCWNVSSQSILIMSSLKHGSKSKGKCTWRWITRIILFTSSFLLYFQLFWMNFKLSENLI